MPTGMNYPPGFGSASDLDHVEGPLFEEGFVCPWCHAMASRAFWRSGGPTILCNECGRDEDEPGDGAWCCDAGPFGHSGRHWKED